MQGLLSLLLFVVILFTLVFVHELGHFLAAKLTGVRAKEFAIGFGRALWKKQWGDTLYRINIFPLGGYVSLEGEEGERDDSPTNYNNKPWLSRAFILVAGVLMNALLAVILFWIYLSMNNYQFQVAAATEFSFAGAESQSAQLIVSGFTDDSPVADVFAKGDLILNFNEENIVSNQDFLDKLEQNKGEEVSADILRFEDAEDLAGEEKTLEFTLPAERNEQGLLLGMNFFTGAYQIEYAPNIFSAVSHTWNMFAYQAQALAESIAISVEEGDANIAAQNVGSIVAVGVVINDLVEAEQFSQLLNLTALVSLSLAFVNLLPLPVLDGGQLVITSIESLLRRPLPQKVKEVMNSVVFVLLIILMLVIVAKDIIQFEILQPLQGLFGS